VNKPTIDVAQLTAAVHALDPVVALLVLIHLSGDRSLLTAYGPAFEGVTRTHSYSFAPRASEETREADPTIIAEIRKRLIAAVQNGTDPLITTTDMALFRQMGEFCAGTAISDAGLIMGREQSGFSRDELATPARLVPPPNFKVLVLGAGMVGLIAAIKLKLAGFNFRVVERNADVGGTWLINRYPNVAVDTPSVQYSLSFEQNSSWTKYYPRGAEYHAYLRNIFTKYRLEDRFDFETEFESSTWDADRNVWVVKCVRDGQAVTYEANVVITAFGGLNRPSYPDAPGLEKFKGPVVHSALWDDDVELDGKKVVVVGTGATALQIVANVSRRAERLSVIQRQPNYIMPDAKVLKDVDPDERWALENIPYVTQWQRFQSQISSMTRPTFLGQIDPEYRARTGGVSASNEVARQLCLNYIATKFADRPDLKAKLTPDYPFFSKRAVLDCGYYDALMRDNVDLIGGSLASADENGVQLADGTYIECDVILLATGWSLDFLSTFDIRGTNGRTLKDVWTPYPFAYKGLEVPGFPNLFVTCGPNSLLTASHTTSAEQQVHYIIETLKLMVDEGIAAFEVDEGVCDAYCREIERKLENTTLVQSGSAHGYYRHASGRVVIAFPGTNMELWSLYRRFEPDDHHLTMRVDAIERPGPERDGRDPQSYVRVGSTANA
jgi:4-hydroxyacetophenone monooxygenase